VSRKLAWPIELAEAEPGPRDDYGHTESIKSFHFVKPRLENEKGGKGEWRGEYLMLKNMAWQFVHIVIATAISIATSNVKAARNAEALDI